MRAVSSPPTGTRAIFFYAKEEVRGHEHRLERNAQALLERVTLMLGGSYQIDELSDFFRADGPAVCPARQPFYNLVGARRLMAPVEVPADI